MNAVLAVGVGGAIGSMLRYAVTTVTQRAIPASFPFGTLVVNVAGSFLAGLLYVWLIERTGARPELRPFLVVGVLGGFTTFSAFSLETVTLMMQSNYGRAALNVAVSIVLCLAGTSLGIIVGRQT